MEILVLGVLVVYLQKVSESAESNLRRLSDDMMEDRSSPTGCMVNGSLYAEGSAMDSSTRCHYCYCIKGQQHCVRPQCLLSETNCTPSFTTDSCCPSKYTCNRTKNDSTTTTSKPSAGCEVEGRFYPEGGLVPRQGGDCENCYCLEGQLRCEPVICSVPVNRHCVPVITTGHCCPTSYNCSGDASAGELDLLDDETQQDLVVMDTQAIDVNHLYVNSERSITGSAKNSENNDFSILTTQATSEDSTSVREERETTTLLDTTTTYRDETTTLEEAVRETTDITSDTPSTTGEDTTIPTTTLITGFTDAEERLNTRIEDLTTTSRMEEITTIINSVSNDTFTSTVSSSKNSSINNLNYSGSDNEKSFPSEIEAILNKTKLASKEEDYDYDYNEPSLPPSLPNLRIIPFVAADAVVDDRQEPVFSAVLDKSHASDDPHFFDGGFSPPAETEGGFVPKEPLLDGPFYESKFDSKYHNNGVLPLDLPPGTHSTLPSITEGTKTPEEEKCQNGGHSYRHGELLTKPSACHLCICYYGKILCQEPKCPVPDPGCRLLRERDHSTCCRKILCNSENAESPTRVVDHVTPASHLPPFTVADVIVTPDPFRDVIRTEPAPDLSSLIGEIMPFFWDQSTASTTPVYLTTTSAETTESAVADTSTASSHTTIRQETADVATFSMEATTSLTSLSTSTHVELADDNKNETKPKLPNDYDYKEVKEEGPAEEEFSFESVLSILFGGETSTEKSAQRTKTQVSHNVKPNNAQPPNMKPINNTEAIKLYPNQILEHRSDEDINELTSSLNNTLEKDHIQQSDTVLDDILEMNKSATGLEYTTKTNPITKKPIDKIVHSTTIRNLISKVSTKRYGTKYSTTHSKPIPTRPTQAANLPLSVPDPGAASGLLKLAGCNIYGRMYRVGRIISELSGPCLECMCTEVGVQCRPLKC